ncbi:MAG: nucleotidyltransferase family protein [Campylobacterota bacterium]|nr:nucleotidyltransferase family protein [Campylobacterota bacterium]
MKAMILAAGRGERMRPLTDTTPKPLLHVKGKALIVWHIEKLAATGFKEIVINIAHLAPMIPKALGDGSQWGVNLHYSDEQEEGALESAGGIIKALPLLGDAPFLVLNADIYTDYEFDSTFDLGDDVANLILVPNPEHHLRGDFALNEDRVLNEGDPMYTFSGIGYYSAEFFQNCDYGRRALAPLLREAIANNRISASLHVRQWHDIGTPQRLEAINKEHNS